MAELHIQRKERSAWPWLLLGALVVALVLWFVFGATDDEPDLAVAEGTAAGAIADPVAPATAEPADAAMPAEAAAFTEFVQTNATAEIGVAHEYTAEGLRRLADALVAVSDREVVANTVDVSARADEIRDHADRLQRNPTSTEHALMAREGTLLAAALMRQLGDTTGAVAETAREAYTTAEQIVPETLLLDQIDTVRRFFDQSANVVRGLAAM